jgi:hypothetical protein
MLYHSTITNSKKRQSKRRIQPNLRVERAKRNPVLGHLYHDTSMHKYFYITKVLLKELMVLRCIYNNN